MADRPHVSFRSLMLGTGPRFARDAVGPVLAFYVAWKLAGLGAGIVVGTSLALAAFSWERRRSRSGLGAAIGLGIALTQALVGALSGSAIGYFAPGVVANAVYGLVFVGSVAIGRPLAGVFASESYPFPPEVKASRTFRRTFSIISLAWGALLLARSAFRLLVLSWGNVDVFVLINVVTGVPITLALMTWSLWYGVESFKRSSEWGAPLAGADQPRRSA
jgi:hypothetical protein